ncbi:uncharacterized protein PG998_004398 [Apiospora kogelbergensis]|uniref:Uncharacterized protein n=1 Tax=Apiospora kogelbergensis TaxID=1337665 RepID=A0AAW0QIF5_9PEZI
MQLISALTLAMAGLASTVSANTCDRISFKGGNQYVVRADGVSDIPGICGGLRDNLHGRSCSVYPFSHSCVEEGGQLVWKFSSTDFCTSGNVEGAWWEATKNRFGDIQCVLSCQNREAFCD